MINLTEIYRLGIKSRRDDREGKRVSNSRPPRLTPSTLPFIGGKLEVDQDTTPALANEDCCIRQATMNALMIARHPLAGMSEGTLANFDRGNEVEKRQVQIYSDGLKAKYGSKANVETQVELADNLEGLPVHGYIDAVLEVDGMFYAYECKSPASASFFYSGGRPKLSNILQSWAYGEYLKKQHGEKYGGTFLEINLGADLPRSNWSITDEGGVIHCTCVDFLLPENVRIDMERNLHAGKGREPVELDEVLTFNALRVKMAADLIKDLVDRIPNPDAITALKMTQDYTMRAKDEKKYRCKYPCSWHNGLDTCQFYPYCWTDASTVNKKEGLF